MRINIIGGGWYGCHLASALMGEHDVILTERATRLFSGASGANPARLHIGPHYPRSAVTRRACQLHSDKFMGTYGHLTRPIAQNLYAIAAQESYVDFGTYRQILKTEIPVLEVYDTAERGLRHVEGALQVSERHVVIDMAREHFEDILGGILEHGSQPSRTDVDLTIDCTFCSLSAVEVDRFEPCITVLMQGPTDTAITIMDGPFPSLYPWNEDKQLCSLTSAKLTPLAKCSTWNEAKAVLEATNPEMLMARADAMLEQMAYYYPQVKETHAVCGWMTSIRAMPKSASDARLVQVADAGEGLLRIRAGKIDAIFEAEAQVRIRIDGLERAAKLRAGAAK